MEIQAAAISLAARNIVVVLAPLTLVDNPGEADLTIDTLQPKFGDVPVVLMAQKQDGTPRYYGEQDIVELLADVPVDKMPWREYAV